MHCVIVSNLLTLYALAQIICIVGHVDASGCLKTVDSCTTKMPQEVSASQHLHRVTKTPVLTPVIINTGQIFICIHGK